ncbi:unnamed protein product [Angiostrongylus costaricensis]|uniref:HintN domain-containing protein n=1 Tax=Angiostrongylus costaricensis TaxID=334426 RepID=A0A158PFN9_ANGCS|nr:unnamed protein product [Angiostrongylus costaricensis]
MLFLTLVLAEISGSMAASCGGSAIPFRFEVLPSGAPVLGCASPSCFGGGQGGSNVYSSFLASPGPDGEDGFVRESDLQRTRPRSSSAPAQQADCPSGFDSQSCTNDRSWVGGFLASPDGSLRLQCCSYDGLRFAEEVGRPVVHSGEVYSGGEVLRDGRQTGFDLISNVNKIYSNDGSAAYELTVVRMNCLPDPVETTNEVAMDPDEITRILDKVGDVRAQEANAYPVQEDQTDEFVQVGEEVIPVTSPGFYYPVASGVALCFTGDTEVETPSGRRRMDQLRIGDLVLTAEQNLTMFTPVISFLHRLPDTVASFIKVQTEDRELKLTPQHFIYKVRQHLNFKKESCSLRRIKSLKVLLIIADQSTFTRCRVYAPMSRAGHLLANDIYVSCHNVVKTSTLSHTFLEFVTYVQTKVRTTVFYHVF